VKTSRGCSIGWFSEISPFERSPRDGKSSYSSGTREGIPDGPCASQPSGDRPAAEKASVDDFARIAAQLQPQRLRGGLGPDEGGRSPSPSAADLQTEVAHYVRDGLRQYWSPDEIAGRSRRDFPDNAQRRVSRQTIYAWIHAQRAAGAHWHRYLRCLGRVRRRSENRGQLAACVSIEGRPAVVDRRARYGDWEGDTVVGRAHQGGAVTLVNRKSGYLLLGKVADRHASTVRQAVNNLIGPLPAGLRRNVDIGQRQGVCRARVACHGSRSASLLCATLFRLAARYE
jgi:hypothetical protein